jgi:hypothetical protein
MNPISQTPALPALPDTHLVGSLVQAPQVNGGAEADVDLKVTLVCTDPASFKDAEILNLPATWCQPETLEANAVNNSNLSPKDAALQIASVLGTLS